MTTLRYLCRRKSFIGDVRSSVQELSVLMSATYFQADSHIHIQTAKSQLLDTDGRHIYGDSWYYSFCVFIGLNIFLKNIGKNRIHVNKGMWYHGKKMSFRGGEDQIESWHCCFWDVVPHIILNSVLQYLMAVRNSQMLVSSPPSQQTLSIFSPHLWLEGGPASCVFHTISHLPSGLDKGHHLIPISGRIFSKLSLHFFLLYFLPIEDT